MILSPIIRTCYHYNVTNIFVIEIGYCDVGDIVILVTWWWRPILDFDEKIIMLATVLCECLYIVLNRSPKHSVSNIRHQQWWNGINWPNDIWLKTEIWNRLNWTCKNGNIICYIKITANFEFRCLISKKLTSYEKPATKKFSKVKSFLT